MRARTDLWEPGASNRLGPPGPRPAVGGSMLLWSFRKGVAVPFQ